MKCFWASRFPAIAVVSTTIFLQALRESDVSNDVNIWKRRSITHPRSGICVTWSINWEMYRCLAIYFQMQKEENCMRRRRKEKRSEFILKGRLGHQELQIDWLAPQDSNFISRSLSWTLICRLYEGFFFFWTHSFTSLYSIRVFSKKKKNTLIYEGYKLVTRAQLCRENISVCLLFKIHHKIVGILYNWFSSSKHKWFKLINECNSDKKVHLLFICFFFWKPMLNFEIFNC